MSSWKDYAPWKWSKKSESGEEGHPFMVLQKQMNALFDDVMSGFGGEGKGFMPRVNMSEDQERVYISAEIPGMEQKDIDLTLTKEAVTIRGEKRTEQERENGKNSYISERSYGCFERRIPLTCEIDSDKVEAAYKGGVLEVILTKTPLAQSQTKKIAIK